MFVFASPDVGHRSIVPHPDARHMANWIDIGPTTHFPEGEHQCLEVDGKPLVIFHVEGQFYAISNICPHAGLPLGEGDRSGPIITCPYHGYAYHIKNGRNIDFPDMEPAVPIYPVRVTDDTLQVDLDAEG